MRLRYNPKAKEHLIKSEYNLTLNNVPQNKKLWIEIGCGKGDFLCEISSKIPDTVFIGVERSASILYKAEKK